MKGQAGAEPAAAVSGDLVRAGPGAPACGCPAGDGEWRRVMRLLVALDRTAKDAAATRAAVQLARATGADVVLCNIVHPWVDTVSSGASTSEGRLEEVV